jgi:phospholipid/cholesterol/gamma-HCH transport system substrate-binding protein
MENRAHALAAGLFVIVLGLAVAVVAWWFGDSRAVMRDVLLVTQRNVNGLNPLAQVRYRGMAAGKVISITLDPQDTRNILVLARVDASLPLTRSTTAQLNSQGITGLSYVQLEDSGKSTELLPVDDDHPARIPLQQTLMDSLGERANEITGQIGVLATRLNRVLDERNLRHLERTMENIAAASEGLRETPRLVASVKAMLSQENMQRINSILVHLERTAGETAPLTREMRVLVASMQTLSQRLEDMSGQIGGQVTDTTLPRFNGLVSDLQDNSRQLKRLLEGIDAAPQSLIFGHPALPPGPGEAGFVVPLSSE